MTKLKRRLTTILVVDDREDARQTAAIMLRELGYGVVEADAGATALDILVELSGTIDLVFSDIMMPGGLNGFELAYAVNDRWPNIKVLLTSGGYPDNTASESDLDATKFWVLPKPYRMAALSAAVTDGLNL